MLSDDPESWDVPAVVMLEMPPNYVLFRHADICHRFEVVVKGSLEADGEDPAPGRRHDRAPGELYGPHTAGPEGCTTAEVFRGVTKACTGSWPKRLEASASSTSASVRFPRATSRWRDAWSCSVMARAVEGTDEDLDPLLEAVEAAGLHADAPCWDDPDVVWSDYDLAVLRSTWDYVPRYDEFLRWLGATEREVPVLNPSSVVRWNTNKRYLADLEDLGLPVVPTRFVAPGQPVRPGGAAEVAVKPVISAQADHAARCGTPKRPAPRAACATCSTRAAKSWSSRTWTASTATARPGSCTSTASTPTRSARHRSSPWTPASTGAFFAPEEITAREPTDDERGGRRRDRRLRVEPSLRARRPRARSGRHPADPRGGVHLSRPTSWRPCPARPIGSPPPSRGGSDP